jgi:ribosomal protein S18 acetylase RimI-like enzyme
MSTKPRTDKHAVSIEQSHDGTGVSPAIPSQITTAAQLDVRPANLSDATSLTFFFDTILRRDYFMKRGQLADMLANTRHTILVAELDSVLVGIAVRTSGTRLVNVLVHPAYRGLGIGSALVEASGASEVRAKLDMSTGDPTSFYQNLGFIPTGRRNDKGNIELLQKPAAKKTHAKAG